MRLALATFVLCILVIPAVAFAGASGSILRVDEETYRVVLDGNEPLAPWDSIEAALSCPEPYRLSCCPLHESLFILSGDFGLPELPEGAWGFADEDQIVWLGAHNYVVQFDFAATPALPAILELNWSTTIVYMAECCCGQSGVPYWRNLVWSYGSGGELYADLPILVGETVPLREFPVAVVNRPWSAVKELYR